jgi:hypothetical protein
MIGVLNFFAKYNMHFTLAKKFTENVIHHRKDSKVVISLVALAYICAVLYLIHFLNAEIVYKCEEINTVGIISGVEFANMRYALNGSRCIPLSIEGSFHPRAGTFALEWRPGGC